MSEEAMTLEEALEHTAVMLLSAARTIHDLTTGVLERKEGLDRAARIAMLRGSDAIAFVAALTQDGLLGKEAEKELRESFPAFDIDHEELLGLHDARQMLQSLVASGAVSPFVNMDKPADQRDPAQELRDAVRELLEAGGSDGIDWKYMYLPQDGPAQRLRAAHNNVRRLVGMEDS